MTGGGDVNRDCVVVAIRKGGEKEHTTDQRDVPDARRKRSKAQ